MSVSIYLFYLYLLVFTLVMHPLGPIPRKTRRGGVKLKPLSFEMSINLHLHKGSFFQRPRSKRVPVILISCSSLSDSVLQQNVLI